ncbi:hypothetical protein [Zobellella denitrificans]
MKVSHDEKNRKKEFIKKKIPTSETADEYRYLLFDCPISKVKESGRNRTIRKIKHTSNKEPIVRWSLFTNLGRCPVNVVFFTNVLSLADANRVIDAITKPNKTPDIVETADAMGCISLADRSATLGQTP